MLAQRIQKHLSTAYENRLLIRDLDSFAAVFDYERLLGELGYPVIFYGDAEQFRYRYETEFKDADMRLAVIADGSCYVPYDIRQSFYERPLSLEVLYPKLNAAVLRRHLSDLDLIDCAYDTLYQDALSIGQAEQFIAQSAWSAENIRRFLSSAEGTLHCAAGRAVTFSDWVHVAQLNAKLAVYAASVGLERSQQAINDAFSSFIGSGYSRLSGHVSTRSPVILPKVMDWIGGEKTAFIVADGMSMFDFEILSRYFSDFDLECSGVFALIPTTTSISRQSLLSGKYPRQLARPFSLANEKSEFLKAAAARGLKEHQCFYGQGCEVLPGPLVRLAAIILRDVDDIVHGQRQGRQGMYHDISLLAKSGKIQNLILPLLRRGFQVYLLSDHGNTCCTGIGSAPRVGVETETKSRRMLVLKDFAQIPAELSDKTFLYPGYYLDKSYQYVICKDSTSFDRKNETVMTHGGITIEEVIVPFVRIRRKQNG